MATTPRGFRDILPDEAEMREHIVATVKARLVHHGYRPIETPLIESASVGGANAWSSDAPFNLFDDNGALLAVRPCDGCRVRGPPCVSWGQMICFPI